MFANLSGNFSEPNCFTYFDYCLAGSVIVDDQNKCVNFFPFTVANICDRN